MSFPEFYCSPCQAYSEAGCVHSSGNGHVEEKERIPTDAQLSTLGRLMRDRPEQSVTIWPGPFDLPEGYVLAQFRDGFTVGIAPTGEGSS